MKPSARPYGKTMYCSRPKCQEPVTITYDEFGDIEQADAQGHVLCDEHFFAGSSHWDYSSEDEDLDQYSPDYYNSLFDPDLEDEEYGED